MNYLKDSDIESMFPANLYRRGLSYYYGGKVKKLNYLETSGVWTAIVEGSFPYFVKVNINNMPQEIDAYCDCPAYKAYDQCKHIVAVLLEISDQESMMQVRSKGSYSGKYAAAADLIQSLDFIRTDLSQHISTGKKTLHIEYILDFSNHDTLFLELRAGEERPYVVRNVQEFIINVIEGHEHNFTKRFSYLPEEHSVDQADLKIFSELLEMIENEQLFAQGGRYYYSNDTIYSSARAIMIPPVLSKEFIGKLTERNVSAKVNERSFSHIEIGDSDLPFEYELNKNNEGELELILPSFGTSIYMESYGLVFIEGTIFYPKSEYLPLIEKITDIQSRNNQIFIAADQADAFVSEVIPRLQKLGTVQVAEKVKEQIIQAPLNAKAYFDIEDDIIKAKLEYHYGDLAVDPFQQNTESDKILLRDVEREQAIMNIIENAGMRYNGVELHIQVDEDELYEMLFTVLPSLEEFCNLYLTHSIKQLISMEQHVPEASVTTNQSAGLLEISFHLEGIEEEEIAEVMKSAIEKKRFYRLRDGTFLSLETDEFQSVQSLFADLDIKKDELRHGSLEVPIYRGIQVDDAIRTRKQYDSAFNKLLDHLRSPEKQTFPLPEGLQATMRDYQKTGYQWFRSLSHYHLGGILADDMGLGKTLQSIAYLLAVREGQQHLIVAPASLIYNWQSEWKKFAPGVETAVITGTPEEREKLLSEAGQTEVLITSYSTLRQDINLYKDKQFHTLILDEAQFIKNYTTKSAAAVREIRASRKFALSGTPIENSVDELWGIFHAILPGLFPARNKFKQMESEKIAHMIKPFILRRLKTDVLKELPEKIESTHITELSKEQKELYIGYLQQIQQETVNSIAGSGFQKSRMKILAGITRLRQLCCHPSLFLDNYKGKSGKMEQLLEIVGPAIENGKRLLIFSQFTSMLDIIGEELKKAGYPYFYLHGQTASKERLEMSDRFNNGERPIFLISLKAGGTGLNLTAADTVILYDLWWNPAVEDQAAGRAHRFGQKNVVQVIRLITRGTIEEKIYELQQRKRKLIEQVIQPGETMLSSLTEEDIKEILSLK